MEAESAYKSAWSNYADDADQYPFRFADDIYNAAAQPDQQNQENMSRIQTSSAGETTDTFSSNSPSLMSNLLQLNTDHSQAYEEQTSKLETIRMLLETSEPEYIFPAIVGSTLPAEDNEDDEQQYKMLNKTIAADDLQGNKSKKEILKEKRERKKVQILERKAAPISEPIFMPTIIEETSDQNKQELTKEEKAERQRVKNRESAQLSRDRKRQQEMLLQQDLQMMTEEVKSLQSLIGQNYTCTSCGTFNNPKKQSTPAVEEQPSQTVEKQLLPSCNCGCAHKAEEGSSGSSSSSSSSSSQPVFQFFDFTRTNNNSISNALSPSSATPLSIGKGPCATFVVLLIITMIVMSGAQQENNRDSAATFMNIAITQNHPYHQIFEHCKGLSQEQLLECLLVQIQELDYTERLSLISQLNLETLFTQQPIVNLEAAATTANELFCTEKPIQESFLDFCEKFNHEQVESDRKYYADLQRQLDLLQQEKLAQLESLKQAFCPQLSEESGVCGEPRFEETLHKRIFAAEKQVKKQQQQQQQQQKQQFPQNNKTTYVDYLNEEMEQRYLNKRATFSSSSADESYSYMNEQNQYSSTSSSQPGGHSQLHHTQQQQNQQQQTQQQKNHQPSVRTDRVSTTVLYPSSSSSTSTQQYKLPAQYQQQPPRYENEAGNNDDNDDNNPFSIQTDNQNSHQGINYYQYLLHHGSTPSIQQQTAKHHRSTIKMGPPFTGTTQPPPVAYYHQQQQQNLGTITHPQQYYGPHI